MAKSKSHSEYNSKAARELLEDARPKREALTASQKALQAEFDEQRRIEHQERDRLHKGDYLEQEEHQRRYHDAFVRSRELETLHHQEMRKKPDVDPALVKAARVELQDNYIAYLERICVLYEQIEAETRRYYQAVSVAYNAGEVAGNRIGDEARDCVEAAAKITNLVPTHKFIPADRVRRIKAHLRRAKNDREKIVG